MKKASQPTVAIVGTGNVAQALAVALHQADIRVKEIIARDAKKSAKLARAAGAHASNLSNAKLDAQLVWICVSDGAIAEVAAQLAKLPVNWKGKTVLHASGPLTSAELSPLKKRGAATASFHPMNTFVPGIATDMRATPFGAEGDSSAIRAGTRLAKALSHGGPHFVFAVKAKDKPLYHAIGALTSPLPISSLNVAERIAKHIGINDPRRLMAPILQSTVANFARGGSDGAFSGPIRRGDLATIRKHLSALAKVPGAKDAYRALALNAVDHLPSKNQAELRKLLKKKK